MDLNASSLSGTYLSKVSSLLEKDRTCKKINHAELVLTMPKYCISKSYRLNEENNYCVTYGRQNDTPFLHNQPNEDTEVQKLRFYLQRNPLTVNLAFPNLLS